MVDRQIIYPRGRVGPTEWIMERRVLIACGLGILCFVVGFMAAGPRLNAGDRIVHSAPPEIVVQPNRAAAPAPTARSPLAPEIEVFPVADATPEVKESEITARVSESPDREVERPRRKKRIRPRTKVEKVEKVENKEPVVVYAPPKRDENNEIDEPHGREGLRDPEIDP